jgi:hypothetical protein
MKDENTVNTGDQKHGVKNSHRQNWVQDKKRESDKSDIGTGYGVHVRQDKRKTKIVIWQRGKNLDNELVIVAIHNGNKRLGR